MKTDWRSLIRKAMRSRGDNMRLRHCGTISYRKCIWHTPCADRKQRHTECAGYNGSVRAPVPLVRGCRILWHSSSHYPGARR